MSENYGKLMEFQQKVETTNKQKVEIEQNIIEEREESSKYINNFSASEVRDLSRNEQIEKIRRITSKNQDVLKNAVSFFRRMTVEVITSNLPTIEVTAQFNLTAMIRSVLNKKQHHSVCICNSSDQHHHREVSRGYRDALYKDFSEEISRRMTERNLFLQLSREYRTFPDSNLFFDILPDYIKTESVVVYEELKNTRAFLGIRHKQFGHRLPLRQECEWCYEYKSRESLLLLGDEEYKEVFKKEHFKPIYGDFDEELDYLLAEETVERNDFLWVITNPYLHDSFLSYLWQLGFDIDIDLVSLEAMYPVGLESYDQSLSRSIETYVPKYKFVWNVMNVVENQDWLELVLEKSSNLTNTLIELLVEGKEIRFTPPEFFVEDE